MLEVAKFKAEKSSNMHYDSMLEVSENALIPKSLMASRKPQYRFFGLSNKPRFRFINGNRNSTIYKQNPDRNLK